MCSVSSLKVSLRYTFLFIMIFVALRDPDSAVRIVGVRVFALANMVDEEAVNTLHPECLRQVAHKFSLKIFYAFGNAIGESPNQASKEAIESICDGADWVASVDIGLVQLDEILSDFGCIQLSSMLIAF
jgi:hypothetical protein